MAGLATRRLGSTIAVLDAVLAQGATAPTHEDLAKVTGLSRRTVDNVLRELREADLVRTGPPRLGGRWGHVLGLALGAESCRAGLVDANGHLQHSCELSPVAQQAKLEPEQLLDRIAEAAHAVLDSARKDDQLMTDDGLPLVGVATAWPCPVRGSKRPAGSVMHPDWLSHEPNRLPEAVAARLEIPPERSHAINDANAHALGVVFDWTRDRATEPADHAARIALVLRLGGGLGASTMIVAPHRQDRLAFVDSIMLGGARSLAGELAHLPVNPATVARLNQQAKWVDGLAPLSSDWQCSCGQTGHLEALASGTAFFRRMEESGITFDQLRDGLARQNVSKVDEALADPDDQRIILALEDLGRLIGHSLAGPILLLDPHLLVLTGSFNVPPVVDGIMGERESWRHVFGDALRIWAPRSEISKYIGVRGAALAVHRRHVHRRLREHVESDPPVQGLTFTI